MDNRFIDFKAMLPSLTIEEALDMFLSLVEESVMTKDDFTKILSELVGSGYYFLATFIGLELLLAASEHLDSQGREELKIIYQSLKISVDFKGDQAARNLLTVMQKDYRQEIERLDSGLSVH